MACTGGFLPVETTPGGRSPVTVGPQVNLRSRGSLHGMDDVLTIGQLSERSGVAHSALRFYEDEGVLTSDRTAGGQRRYHRDALRRVSFVRAAQQVGLSLDEIAAALASLPSGR